MEKQLSQICIFIAVVLAALGGCWWPIEIVPEPFRIVALLTPSYWAMRGLQGVMYFAKPYPGTRACGGQALKDFGECRARMWYMR